MLKHNHDCRTRMRCLAGAALLVATVCACGEPPPESFSFAGAADGSPVSPPIDACWLAEPSGSIVYMKLAENTEVVLATNDCVDNEPYAASHLEYIKPTIHVVAGVPIPKGSIISVEERTFAHPDPPMAAGAEGIAAIRESNGEYFLTRWVAIARDGTNTSEEGVNLPTTWDELVSEMERVQLDTAERCPSLDARKVWSDEEFRSWVYDADRDLCHSVEEPKDDLEDPNDGYDGP